MKKTLIILTILSSAACTSTKKSSSAASTSAVVNTGVTPEASVTVTKSKDGIYAPGEEELTAIQVTYKDVSLAQLQEGYALYTKGACINCHDAKNIYRYNETSWKGIIDDMAAKAKITDPEKDAVYKYVLAIKAKQP